MDIANFPSLTAEEFEEACHHLDRRYRQATLGMLRMRWKLRLRSALNYASDFAYADMPKTIIEITKPFEYKDEDLGLDMHALSLSEGAGTESEAIQADQEMEMNEASDEV